MPQLIVKLLYGSGLRIMEAVRLRLKDVDFQMKQITVRSGKGDKDLVTTVIHDQDIVQRHGEVYLPYALSRKYPRAGKEWGWQYMFPARDLSTDPLTGTVRRHHLDPSVINKAIKTATRRTGLTKQISAHKGHRVLNYKFPAKNNALCYHLL